jgi:chromosome segregation ATPase
MEPVLLVLLALAALAAVFFGLQLGGARAASAKALREVAANQERLAKLEGDSKKSAEALDAKRREIDELKDRLKDVKRKRHEEQEAARLKNDLEEVREQVEREMEKKLAQAREEAEVSKAAMRRLSAEVESLKARRPTPAPAAPPEEAKPAVEKVPQAARPLKDEERARLDSAEKGLAKAKGRLEELEAEVKRLKGRAETDRRVFIVQKGEIDLAKDRFRSLESRYNELVLERDELAKQVWTLDKQLKALHPTAETAAKAPKDSAQPNATGEAKPAESRPAAAEPTSGEPVAKA